MRIVQQAHTGRAQACSREKMQVHLLASFVRLAGDDRHVLLNGTRRELLLSMSSCILQWAARSAGRPLALPLLVMSKGCIIVSLIVLCTQLHTLRSYR